MRTQAIDMYWGDMLILRANLCMKVLATGTCLKCGVPTVQILFPCQCYTQYRRVTSTLLRLWHRASNKRTALHVIIFAVLLNFNRYGSCFSSCPANEICRMDCSWFLCILYSMKLKQHSIMLLEEDTNYGRWWTYSFAAFTWTLSTRLRNR